MKDVDIRESRDDIADAIRAVVAGEPYEIYNSDEDYDDEPAARAVMISQARYEALCDYEFRYRGLEK